MIELQTKHKQIYGNDAKLISDDGWCEVWKYENDNGEAVITSYSVFPGVSLAYNDVHLPSGQIERTVSDTILEINHCREGRMECELRDEFFYLAPGDFSIARKKTTGRSSYFPLSHYHGITILIDTEHATKCLSCLLADVEVAPDELSKKFCGEDGCYIARSKPYIAHIFSELYSVPESIKKGYFKVKILELLLYLSGMEPENETTEIKAYSQNQTELAKSVCKYLTEHMDDRITLAQISDIFHISGTQIKNSFKGVYGVSVYSYIRTQKMHSAALMLRHTKRSVIDIAGCFGYDNASKFASAFKNVIGMTPNEYRNADIPD